jgi:hypothetical protein
LLVEEENQLGKKTDEEKDEEKNYNFNTNFLFNDIAVFNSPIFNNEFGFSYENDFVLNRVKYAKNNNFYFELMKIIPAKELARLSRERQWGFLSGISPVADDTVAPTLQVTSPDSAKKYFKNLAEFKLVGKDARGKIESATFKFQLSGKKVSGDLVDVDLSQKAVIETYDFGQNVYFTVPLPALDEGDYSIMSEVSDYAGNKSNVIVSEFHIDRTAPVVHLGINDNMLTNQPELTIPTDVVDRSPVDVSIEHDELLVFESGFLTILKNDFKVTLDEGSNSIVVFATDAAGNVSEPVVLENVTLDTIPPKLTNILPVNNSITSYIKFPVTADSDEPLKSVFINDLDTGFTSGSSKLNYIFKAEREGPFK